MTLLLLSTPLDQSGYLRCCRVKKQWPEIILSAIRKLRTRLLVGREDVEAALWRESKS